MLFAATLSAVIYAVIAQTTINEADRSSDLLLNNLRRTLMQDNIDYYYSFEETNDTLTLDNNKTYVNFEDSQENNKKTNDPEYSKEGRDHGKVVNFYVPDLTKKIGKIQRKFNIYKPKPKIVEHKVSNNDLLYYMDDRNLVYESPVKYSDHQEDKEDSMTTNKYKVLKLKHKYRRKGQPHLIQEESKEKIVIVNLNNGPIPLLRLPRSRRQYMRDPGEAEVVADDEEIPPPEVNTSDPEAAPLENDTITEAIFPDMTQKETVTTDMLTGPVNGTK